jgi:dephospho-CoA kinase
MVWKGLNKEMMKKLILITGMSGSGKTTLAEMFREKGYRVVSMGDVIRKLAEKRGINPTPNNLGCVAKKVREKGGEATVAETCIDMLKGLQDPVVVIDGIRSMKEVYAYRKNYDLVLIAVYAPSETRYIRLKNRGRSDDPPNKTSFYKRDERELGFNLGQAIRLADYAVMNIGNLNEFREEFEELIDAIEKN